MTTRNAIKCLKCGDEIESKHRHDFVSCKCGACFVDGGRDYRRVGYENMADVLIWDNEKGEFVNMETEANNG